ncbi:MAG: hypothetical protein WAW80_03695 [Candidatus Saccharimonadales bacterium]
MSRFFWAYVIMTVIFGGAGVALFISDLKGSIFCGFSMVVLLAIAISDCRNNDDENQQESVIDTKLQ